MKTMFRLMAPAVLALLALGAIACGGGSEPAPPPAEEPKPAEEAKPAEDAKPADEAEPADEAKPADEAAAADAAPAANADGATAYNTYCSSCHGATGAGDGPAGGALNPKPANFADAAFWNEKRTDEHLTTVIKDGGPAVGLSPLMAPWGAVLDDAKVAAVIAHMKTLKK